MKFRLLAKKYYFKTTAKTRFDTQFDYDTSGELSADMYLKHEPCFAHVTVKEDISYQRRVIIYNGKSPDVYSYDLNIYLKFGFLIYFILEGKLVPIINWEASHLEKAEVFSKEDLQILLKRYSFKTDEVFILEDLGREDIFRDTLLDSYNITAQPEFSNRKNYVYVYTTETERAVTYGTLDQHNSEIKKSTHEVVAYSMIGPHGSQIKQITNLPADKYPDLIPYTLEHDLYSFMLQKGHIEDYVDMDQSRIELILELYNSVFWTDLACAKPDLEVMVLVNPTIQGELPPFSLPKLRNLSIAYNRHLPRNGLAYTHLQRIIDAAPNVIRCKFENVCKPQLFVAEKLQLRASLQLLSISVEMLPYVQLPKNNALIALEITPYSGNDFYSVQLIHAADLERLVQSCPLLELLYIPEVNFHSLPRNLPSHIRIEYSKDTLDKFQLDEVLSAEAQMECLKNITKAKLIHKLEKYLRLKTSEATEVDSYLSFFEAHSDEVLAWCFAFLKYSKRPDAMHLAWDSFVSSIGSWDENQLPSEDSLVRRSLDHLWLGMYTCLFPKTAGYSSISHPFTYSKAVFSLEPLWSARPFASLLLCDESQSILLSCSFGYWCYFDPNKSVSTFDIIPYGEESRIRTLLEQRFAGAALEVRTQSFLHLDLNPEPSSKKVVDYIKAGGLLTLLRIKDEEAFSYLSVNTLSEDDLSPLFEMKYNQIEVYKMAYHYRPILIRRMLERYQSFHPHFVIPEFDDTTSVQDDTDNMSQPPSTLLTLKPETTDPLLENRKRAPVERRKAFHSASFSLPEEWYDTERWLQRPCAQDLSQRFILDKLQDYLVVKYGMTAATWQVLNTLETGIARAIAYCFAEFWTDQTITDPNHLIMGWKDALTALRYCPAADTHVSLLLQTVWFYTYSTHFAQQSSDSYQYQQMLLQSDLPTLLAEYPEHPLILTNDNHAVTLLYREGIWYLFDVQDVTGEPQYFRCGDESALITAIGSMLPDDLTLISRHSISVKGGIDKKLSPKSASVFAEQGTMLLPPLGPQNIAFVKPKSHSESQDPERNSQPLFVATPLINTKKSIAVDDPSAEVLSQCSVEFYADLPKRPSATLFATIQLDDDLGLDELDDDLLEREGQNILVQFSNQSHLDLYLDHLLATPQAKKRGVWIVNNMRDLQCAVSSLKIHEDNSCEEIPAPAGDFYQALQTYPELIIALNVSGFTFKEMVQVNPLLDTIRSNDNILIPKKALVLSLQNTGDPNAYRGDDFISRQDEEPIEIPSCLPIPPILDFGVTHSDIDFENRVEIDFYHSVHWQKYLYGALNPSVEGMRFTPSILMKQSFESSLKITYRNAPLGLAGFRQAVYNILQQRRIRYYGREILLPNTVQMDYVEGYLFPLAPYVPAFTRQYSSNYDKVLNPSTANDLFVQYQFTPEGMIGLPGVVEQFAGRELTLYVTRDVSYEVWSRLLHQVQQFGCQLQCILAEKVQLPEDLDVQNLFSLPLGSEEAHPSVSYVLSTEGYALVISVENLTAQDLFYRRFKDKQGVLREEICDMWQFLLEERGRVLLVGNCSLKLQDHLWDVINGKGYLHNGHYERPKGTIEFLSPKMDKALLAKRPVRQNPIPDSLPEDGFDTSDDFSLAIVKAFNRRRDQDMSDALRTSRLVCLLGNTGVGKSHFMQNYPGVIFDNIEKWLENGGILFLDEANLKYLQWENFESVMWEPPSFIYKGKYYFLTDQHKIVVAMNPSNYSRERQTPELFHTYANVVVFSSFPNAYLYHEMLHPILGDCNGHELMIGRVFLQVYQMVKYLEDSAFSVRELQMMACSFKATPYLFPDDDRACALYHAYHTAVRVLPKAKQDHFYQLFVQKWRHIPEPSRIYPTHLQGEKDDRFELMSIHYPAYAALDDFMAVREYRKGKGGLSCFVLEGEPGTGKSLFLKLYLISKGLKEEADFYYIPAKWSPLRKKEHFLCAFHAGKIAFMEELNASDMIEEVLNSVLSGVDLEGMPAKTPGFVLLGTQNSSAMSGRNTLSIALQRRLICVQFPSYTLTQMFQVLLKQNMPLTIAYGSVMRALADPSLGFRSIYKDAKSRRGLLTYPLSRVSISLPDVFWRVRNVFHPLTVADSVLLQAIHKKGWASLVYQATNSEYYFHDFVYRKLKQHYSQLQSLRIRLEDNSSTLLRTAFQYIDKPRIKITKTVFAHLEIDMEMPGLAGLQGEREEHIFGCFGQYIAEQSFSDSRVLAFSRAVDALLLHCRVMQTLNTKNTRSRQGFYTYCKETAQQIQLAQLGQDYFFAGGWLNQPPGSSHSIIYRLERKQEGLRFYIYNAGAGLAEHEKVSGEYSERYYPVKVYDIPDPIDEKELSYLLQRLLLPNLVDHPARTQEHEIVDATKLYRNIEKSLEHMNAQQVLAKNLFQEGVVTQGVMAGACTLSIQQLFNCYLNDPDLYRCLMLDLKLYVMKEFITSHPAPRYAHINRMLILAIENNLKILLSLQEDHSPALAKMMDPSVVANYLRTTKQQICSEGWVTTPAEQGLIQGCVDYGIDWIPDVTTMHPLEFRKKEPLGELMQIEREILAFESANVVTSFTKWMVFGGSFFKNLEVLQARYQKLYTDCYGDIQLPRMFLIHFSLLHACAQSMPDYTDCFHKELGAFFAGYENCPHLATYNLDLDEKLRQMMQRYVYRPLDYDSYFLNKYVHIIARSDEQHKRILGKLYMDKYAHNQQPLHLEVRAQQVQALYALLEELDDDGYLKKHTKLDAALFQPLIDRIRLQMRVENFIVRSFRMLLNQPLPGMAKPKLLHQKNRLKMVTQLSKASVSQHAFCMSKAAVYHHKYRMQDSPEKDALLADVPIGTIWAYKNKEKLSENDIQLVDNKMIQRMGACDFFIRELTHLRLLPEHQIILTLDYFLGEISHVSSPTTQIYIEANIFQPGLLGTYLSDPDLLKKWDLFMQAALNECRNAHGELSHTSLFFLRLQFYFNRYFSYIPRLRQNVVYLQELIDKQRDRDILSTLHQCKFLSILTINDPALFVEAYESYVLIQASGNHYLEQDTASEDELRRARYQYKQWLSSADATPQKWMQSVLKKHPWLAAATDRADPLSGKLYYKEFALSPLPVYWKNLPILGRLGLHNDTLCAISFDEQIIEFGVPNPYLRALKFNERWVFQKKWRKGSAEDWYELCPLSLRQVQRFGLDKEERGYPHVKHHLPDWLTDEDTQAWVHTKDKNKVIFVQNNQICYEWHADDQRVRYIKNELDTADLLELPSEHIAALLQYESAQFIVHYAYAEQHIIHFPRYGFDLTYDAKDKKIHHPATQTTLSDQSASPFAANVACLTFEKSGHPVVCIVPIQPFYVLTHEVQTVAQYYSLVHDISMHIPAAHMTHVWDAQGIAKKDQPMWRFADSEKYSRFRIVDGKPQADTPEDALYLCYLYLATHDLPQAWRVLNDLNRKGGISGTETELKYLEWITNKLPAVDVPSDYTVERMQNEALRAPRYIACKLKALALLTRCIQQGKLPHIPDHPSADNSANTDYAVLQTASIRKFYTQLPSIVALLHTQFLQAIRYLPQTFELDNHACESLLTYIDEEGSPARGSLGVARLQLNLKLLLKLEHNLLALRQGMGHQWTFHDQRRLERIQQELQKQIVVSKKTTRLDYVAIDLTLPNAFNDQILRNNPQCMALGYKNLASTPVYPDAEAIDMLSSMITAEELLRYLPNLLRIACQNESQSVPTHDHRKRLKQYCQATLRAARYVSLSAQDSPIPYVANVLYRLLTNHGCLDNQTISQWDEVVARVQGLYTPPIYVLQACDVYEEILSQATDMVKELRARMFRKESIETLGVPIDKWKITVGWSEEYRQAATYSKIGSEQTVGSAMYRQMQEKKRIAGHYLQDAVERASLRSQAARHQASLEVLLGEKWAAIECLAHKDPEDATEKESHLNAVFSAQRDLLSKQDLLKLYLHQNRGDYYAETTLTTAAEVDRLHTMLHEYVSLSVQNQKMGRVLRALEGDDFLEMAETVLQESSDTAQGDPSLMLFQYLDNKLIRPRQIEALQRLLESIPNGGFREIVEKILMGGGKSKLVLPILAQKKANGTNLVVVEAQRALLKTQHRDMNQLSQDLFNQSGHLFEFNRDSDCSAARLKQIYRFFEYISIHKDYLVTTGESMQSLHLKYRELLRSRPKNAKELPEWHQQIMWAEKIVKFLKSSGDAILDEVQEGLRQNKKLNYTFGPALPVDAKTIDYSIQLFELMERYPDCLANEARLIDCLFRAGSGPLQHVMPHALQRVAKNYLSNRCNSIPLEILALDRNTRNALAFYKEQVVLLPRTAALKYKEKYGPSKQYKKNPAEQAIAIPYKANNRPNERSRFGHVLKMINCTIQGMLHQGIEERLLCHAIQQWQIQARKMMQDNPRRYAQMNATPLAKKINILLQGTGLTLQTIDIKRAEDRILLKQKAHDRSFIYRVLQDLVLPCIPQEQSVLHGDSYDHIDLYRSSQGLSGTPGNHKTFKRMQYDESSALGNDGYLLEVLKEKITGVRAQAFLDLSQFIHALHPTAPTQALIDICARFAGFDSIEVACALAQYFAEQRRDVKYVLYFNEDDMLCALPVLAQDKPVILGTTDPEAICQKLGDCSLEHCFTYYDQERTLGLDLTHIPNAQAQVLVDKNTYLQPILQGCTRMRGLEKQQTLDLILTPDLEGISVTDLLQRSGDLEEQNALENNAAASVDKLENIIRLDLEQRILAIDFQNSELKHRYMLAFERFFFEQAEQKDHFDKYGAIYHKNFTQTILRSHQRNLLRKWRECLALVSVIPQATEESNVTKQMNEIIFEAKNSCPEMILNRLGEKQFDEEVEAEKELELDLEKLDEYYDANLTSVPHSPWNPRAARPLSTWTGMRPHFAENLLYSPNFAQVYQEQASANMDRYTKPVHLIYFVKHRDKLTACLVTQAEAREIRQNNPHGQWWLTTTRHSSLGGRRPDDIENDVTYQSLIEQIRYFNGELNAMLDSRKPCVWLNKDPEEKLDFYAQRILPNREANYVRDDALDILKNQSVVQEPISILGQVASVFTSFFGV